MFAFLRSPPPAVCREQVNNLFNQSPFLFIGLLSTILIVALYFWESVDRSLLLVWTGSNLLLMALRVVMVKRYQRIGLVENAVYWGYLFTLSSMISGMLWGAFPVFLLDTSKLADVFFLTTIMTGIVAGSLVPLSVFFPAHHVFSSFTLLPLIVVALLDEQRVLFSIGILLIIYLLVMYAFSLVVNATIRRSIELRFENLDLLENLKKQKEIAEKANTDKSRFLAATSHDLRQPLHAMDLYLGALANLIRDAEQHALLEKSRQASKALNSLLTALMDISRLDAGEVVIERKPVDVRVMLENIANEFREQAGDKNIRIDVSADDAVVDSDPLMLSRMLRNLLNNACAHSGADAIQLRARQQGDTLELAVCDNGCGIPFDKQEKVFSEFYQLHNPERDRSKGLGLGLAIVHRLAALLQHDLRLRSAPGEGCCFYLSLPCLSGVVPGEQAADEILDSDISGSFIIFVDDEAGVRDAMRILLRQWGCEVLMADGLQSLREELQAQSYPQPDWVISDYRLRDDTSGLDVVALVQQHFDAGVPAIIISGDTDKAVAHKVKAAGYRLLHKPVQPAVLRQAIAASGTADT